MRIIAGQHRGLQLASVGQGDTDAHLRPTSDRVRESLFNILSHYGQPSGARVLDLFAGTGALGLEALSRGATHVTYVENGRAGQKLILENLTKARRTQDATLLKSDATSLPPAKVPCNLVFLDPPYGKALGEQALASARAQGWLSEDALVVWEESAPMYAPQGFTLEDQRKYGSTVITLLRA
ncbi:MULTISPECIES: 16S rRNA (guanine(966)-N(2))-methyltransferase RsmD [Lentibacter]|mgnify:FL=1|uniref:16S rRNA (Guanine966-N2)-methyltransferase n=1 Tax=Lentibacter algarum TaxID=576131 RepID=A0A1H3H6X6_9RHOB|nr:16S rRNA (guanine(966)-N(2))-methyltransferase RsmD [Lentibacter algarum]MCO4777956.1 16S rRNA (guanine(966)-N(2))-methyltransferase RsmD [Lentibacter algarum]MCO4826758.1 16S rRNA (guanine(966)-N(2))-methyltransferase RsmD [Lentibacter algarum]WIF30712.1 ribosomal RNA small subunit methyltransferase D [Lentibacter algarum]SDY11100.1 16S rRNA (guanine966-N2)-methyltransferase [Lentibacter algarum]